MSKQRMIDTKFWDDNYASNLDPIEKLLFLYFLTNTSTNISGIYEIPLKKIAVETGIEKEMVSKILNRFTEDKKIFYENGWICLKNFVKNQNQKSPKVQVGIKNELNLIPKDILDKFIQYGYPITFNIIESNEIESKIELPSWLNKKAWGAWEQHRKEKKKTLTPTSKKLQLKLLEENKDDHVQIIKNSITNGWTGLFPLRGELKKITPPKYIEPNDSKEVNDRRNILNSQSAKLVTKFSV